MWFEFASSDPSEKSCDVLTQLLKCVLFLEALACQIKHYRLYLQILKLALRGIR